MHTKIIVALLVGFVLASNLINSQAQQTITSSNAELVFYNQSNTSLFIKLCDKDLNVKESPMYGSVLVNDKLSNIITKELTNYKLLVFSADSLNDNLKTGCNKPIETTPTALNLGTIKDKLYIETLDSTKLTNLLSGVSKREITYKTTAVQTQISKDVAVPLVDTNNKQVELAVPFSTKEQDNAYKIQASSILEITGNDKELTTICVNGVITNSLPKSLFDTTNNPDSIFFKLEPKATTIQGISIVGAGNTAVISCITDNLKSITLTPQAGLKYILDSTKEVVNPTTNNFNLTTVNNFIIPTQSGIQVTLNPAYDLCIDGKKVETPASYINLTPATHTILPITKGADCTTDKAHKETTITVKDNEFYYLKGYDFKDIALTETKGIAPNPNLVAKNGGNTTTGGSVNDKGNNSNTIINTPIKKDGLYTTRTGGVADNLNLLVFGLIALLVCFHFMIKNRLSLKLRHSNSLHSNFFNKSIKLNKLTKPTFSTFLSTNLDPKLFTKKLTKLYTKINKENTIKTLNLALIALSIVTMVISGSSISKALETSSQPPETIKKDIALLTDDNKAFQLQKEVGSTKDDRYILTQAKYNKDNKAQLFDVYTYAKDDKSKFITIAKNIDGKNYCSVVDIYDMYFKSNLAKKKIYFAPCQQDQNAFTSFQRSKGIELVQKINDQGDNKGKFQLSVNGLGKDFASREPVKIEQTKSCNNDLKLYTFKKTQDYQTDLSFCYPEGWSVNEEILNFNDKLDPKVTLTKNNTNTKFTVLIMNAPAQIGGIGNLICNSNKTYVDVLNNGSGWDFDNFDFSKDLPKGINNPKGLVRDIGRLQDPNSFLYIPNSRFLVTKDTTFKNILDERNSKYFGINYLTKDTNYYYDLSGNDKSIDHKSIKEKLINDLKTKDISCTFENDNNSYFLKEHLSIINDGSSYDYTKDDISKTPRSTEVSVTKGTEQDLKEADEIYKTLCLSKLSCEIRDKKYTKTVETTNQPKPKEEGCIKTSAGTDQGKLIPALTPNCYDSQSYMFRFSDWVKPTPTPTPPPVVGCDVVPKPANCNPDETPCNPDTAIDGNCDEKDEIDPCDDPDTKNPDCFDKEETSSDDNEYITLDPINEDEEIPLDFNLEDELGSILVDDNLQKVKNLPNVFLDKLGVNSIVNDLTSLTDSFDASKLDQVVEKIKSLSSNLFNTIGKVREVIESYYMGIAEGVGQGIGNIYEIVEGFVKGILGGFGNVSELFFSTDSIKQNCVKDDWINPLKWASCYAEKGIQDFGTITNCVDKEKGGWIIWGDTGAKWPFTDNKIEGYIPNVGGLSSCTADKIIKPRFDKFVDNTARPYKDLIAGLKSLFDPVLMKSMALAKLGELNELLSQDPKDIIREFAKTVSAFATENGIIAIATIFTGGGASVGFGAKVSILIAKVGAMLSIFNILKPFIKAGKFIYKNVVIPIKKVGDKIVSKFLDIREGLKKFSAKILDKLISKLPEPLKSKIARLRDNKFDGDGSGCSIKSKSTGKFTTTKDKCNPQTACNKPVTTGFNPFDFLSINAHAQVKEACPVKPKLDELNTKDMADKIVTYLKTANNNQSDFRNNLKNSKKYSWDGSNKKTGSGDKTFQNAIKLINSTDSSNLGDIVLRDVPYTYKTTKLNNYMQPNGVVKEISSKPNGHTFYMGYEKSTFNDRTQTGTMTYCGISDDVARRNLDRDNLSNGNQKVFKISSITGLSKNEARALEQYCIEEGKTRYEINVQPSNPLAQYSNKIYSIRKETKNKYFKECANSWAKRVVNDMGVKIGRFGEKVEGIRQEQSLSNPRFFKLKVGC